MNPHKHAEVLRAIADGVPLNEFEVRGARPGSTWMTLESADFTTYPDFWEVRRKPQYIMVNGFKVPKPLDVMEGRQVYWPYLSHSSLWDSAGPDNKEAQTAVARKIAHANQEAAIAHAKAMLGIDPEAE